ncbi:HAD family hydrolase [Vibrio mimicus]|uniref:Hydrolase n=1 Tax=Vibrio mimicus TaxID=674 RepID=A0A2J9VJC0_VIBMI|nr:HAD family hydrolase [Vibrio mimicus]EEW09199.1 Putative hydrolase [Vibrio mimicus VM573]KFE29418.1 HAD hydrolase, IA, variant 1 family protein [Vibrio mimicus]PNM63886.1 hydrolase [Vibrio mimicus]
MIKTYLFDWGDTLMVDFPDQTGRMCDWTVVEAVDSALETLKILSAEHSIYVATNAADSSEIDIETAFARVGLNVYIDGYFCQANLGLDKGTPEYFRKIVACLEVDPSSIVMVGDTYENDIEPAITAGIQAIWFNPLAKEHWKNKSVKQITHLSELCT